MEKRGIVRKIDDLGRVTLPKLHRDRLGWGVGEEIEITLTEDGFTVKSPTKMCVCCGNSQKLVSYRETNICVYCLGELCAARELA